VVKGPKGEKRPADVIGDAVPHVMRIATGHASEELKDAILAMIVEKFGD
jgi:hypothetical protein